MVFDRYCHHPLCLCHLALFATTLSTILLCAFSSSQSHVLDNGLAYAELVYPTEIKTVCHTIGKPLNLIFVLDSSGSLADKFEEERQVIRDIIKTVVIHPDYTSIALVQYSGIAQTEFNFNLFNSKKPELNLAEALKAVDRTRFINGITKTGDALEHTMSLLKDYEGWRPNERTILFLISDGRSYDKPRNLDEINAAKIKAMGIDIYAYGTGEYVAIEELYDLTGDESRVFSKSKQSTVRKNYADMITFFSEYAGQEICEELPACIPGSDKPTDLLFLVDGSRSLKLGFNKQLDFLQQIIGHINVHPEAVRVAMIQYSTRARVSFDFLQYRARAELTHELKSIEPQSGITNTNGALRFAAQFMRDSRERRADAETMVVVLTDGHSRNSIGPEADELLEAVDTVYAVAVNHVSVVDVEELYHIAKDWSKVFTSDNLTMFQQILPERFSHTCHGRELHDANAARSGEPVEVSCSSYDVTITARTQLRYAGRMYARGYYNEPGCYQIGDGYSNEITLQLQAGRCGIKQIPETSGYRYSGSVMLQFHPNAVTSVDKILDISCFHPDNSASSRLQELNLKVPQDCGYHIRKLSPDGCVALDSRVGESLFHTWTCNSDATQYGYLVHTCFVEDNNQKTLQLMNSKGCPLDIALFGVPTYSHYSSQVLLESASFRMPGAQHVRFKCDITVCDRAVGACDNILPPRCEEPGAAYPSTHSYYTSSGLPTFTVISKWITMLDSKRYDESAEIHFCDSYLGA